MSIVKYCLVCGKEFLVPKCRECAAYCSTACQHESMRRYTECVCRHCGKTYTLPEYRVNEGGGVYCSVDCRIAEGRKKMKEYIVTMSCQHCGQDFKIDRRVSARQGGAKYCSWKCYTDHRRKNASKDEYRINAQKQLYHWRKAVLKRYDHACAHCGSRDNITAHHVIPYSIDESLRFDVSNGMCLCASCHNKEHERLKKASKQQRDLFAPKWFKRIQTKKERHDAKP